MDRLAYIGFRILIAIFSIIPFGLLHILADGLAFILHRVVRYRYSVILTNLQNAFPEKSSVEIQRIIKGNYQNLADIILESIKGYSEKAEDLVARFKIDTSEVETEKGRSYISMGAHYGNWEWGVFCGGLQSDRLVLCYYKPIKNPYIDAYYRKRVEANNFKNIPLKKAARTFVTYHKETVSHLMIADQSPTMRNKAIWVDFLNQKTACLNGAEKFAKKFDYPVFYMDAERVKRGYYALKLKKIVSQPKETAEGEITETYMNALEERIRKKPEDWLWSHKRWKKKQQPVS